jgi:outer membrane receptor protein involved in Fe transport
MQPVRRTLAVALSAAISLAAATAGHAAQPADAAVPDSGTALAMASAGVSEFDRVVVTARTERAPEDVPSTVTAVDREEMDRQIVRDLKDLFRYEPGITVTSSFGRFGLGNVRIRGLGGNRVRMETDGISVPEAFAIGSFSNANRNFVDLDTLKRVEVVRGPDVRCTDRTRTAAAYVQDEVVLAGGALRLVSGVRLDYYKLDPEVDSIFAADNPGIAVSELSETSVSPKLGVVWHFSGHRSLFGGYQHGFRAPPYSDVNLGFTNLQFGYTAITNPDLKPETSDGIELGLRFGSDAVFAELSAYYNRYDDFIESQRFVGIQRPGPDGVPVAERSRRRDLWRRGARRRRPGRAVRGDERLVAARFGVLVAG